MPKPRKTPLKDRPSSTSRLREPVEDTRQHTEVARYLKRRNEVVEKDHAEFQVYLNEKAVRDARTAPADQGLPPLGKADISRRNMLKVVAGTAAAGEAALLGYSWVKGGSVSEQGFKHAGDRYTAPQTHDIVRELINPKADIGGRGFGKWVIADADQAGRRDLCARPQSEPRAGLDLVLELWRLQSDLASSLRVPERRSLSTASSASTARRAARTA